MDEAMVFHLAVAVGLTAVLVKWYFALLDSMRLETIEMQLAAVQFLEALVGRHS